jgi:hypothetical protein
MPAVIIMISAYIITYITQTLSKVSLMGCILQLSSYQEDQLGLTAELMDIEINTPKNYYDQIFMVNCTRFSVVYNNYNSA